MSEHTTSAGFALADGDTVLGEFGAASGLQFVPGARHRRHPVAVGHHSSRRRGAKLSAPPSHSSFSTFMPFGPLSQYWEKSNASDALASSSTFTFAVGVTETSAPVPTEVTLDCT